MSNIRPIAIHLPQFHPIPENDIWWGEGFTEWTNTKKSVPRFENHYQPHEPSDLGYYDLRNLDSLKAQAQLASEYGIYGFCFYHYWFNGKRVLEKPVDTILQNKDYSFPFCLCWANENWTRRWDGNDKEVLLSQEYSFEDDIIHIHHLFPYFTDERYIKVAGKPLFIIYRPGLFPDIKKTIKLWRNEARKNGIGELYITYMQAFAHFQSPESLGFDAAIEFQPDFNSVWNKSFLQKIILNIKGTLSSLKIRNNDFIFEYETLVNKSIQKKAPAYKQFPGITPMWDNSARRATGATIFHGSTPKLYGEWLRHILEKFKPFSKDENFIFINAWNEWAEGNHLEPCKKWGRKYLEETKYALNEHT
jgi:lipopolysaccharide biosynthesis protein